MAHKKRKVCRSEMAMTVAKMHKVFKRVQQFYLMTAFTLKHVFKNSNFFCLTSLEVSIEWLTRTCGLYIELFLWEIFLIMWEIFLIMRKIFLIILHFFAAAKFRDPQEDGNDRRTAGSL